jgi:glycosyltransferase involved in cell wall biosynthesis
VHLITAQEGADAESVPDGMRVEVVGIRPTLNDRYLAWKRDRAAAATAPGTNAGGTAPGSTAGEGAPMPGSQGSGPGLLATLRTEVGGLLGFPDEGRGWIEPLSSALAHRIREYRPDLVVSSGPPHSLHLGTWKGRSGSPVPWIADFRDPWSDEARVHLDVGWTRPFLARLEDGVIRTAAGVFTTTPELAETYRVRYPGLRAAWLPNGVDVETLPPRPTHRGPGLRVAHIGSLYHRRDPVPAVRAFARFVRENPAARSDGSVLAFVGKVKDEYREQIGAAAREEGVSDLVELLGIMPRAEALDVLASTGVALTLAQDQETAIPAKIYESIGMRIPTLVITEPHSASAGAGRRLGAAVHEADDLEGMARSLEAAWNGSWTGELPDGVLLDYADLAAEAERLFARFVPDVGP